VPGHGLLDAVYLRNVHAQPDNHRPSGKVRERLYSRATARRAARPRFLFCLCRNHGILLPIFVSGCGRGSSEGK
jgi:hypothetical protein